jgi:sugar lactone lactonase YvrE
VKRFVTKRFIAMTLMIVMCISPMPVLADSPYEGYIYDSRGDTPRSINGYLYQDSIDGYDLSSGPFLNPTDIFIAMDNTIYISDTGNNRIVHIDADKQVLGIYGDQDGMGKLSTPKGIFVTEEGLVYVADNQNRRIVVFDSDGKFMNEFLTPESSLLGSGFTYSPSKLVVDKRNYMFVVSEGTYQGLLQLDPNGEFKGYFGANHIGFSWEKIFTGLIATEEQKAQLATAKPPEFSNLFADDRGFIYTTTFGVRNNQIKRLSAVGVDTLNPRDPRFVNVYGDRYMRRQNWRSQHPSFVDVTVSEQGLITGLDQISGKIYQYDKLGHLLFIFGGLGNQNGLFSTPSSIEHSIDGTIYVVDNNRSRIDRFRTTPFADKVHEASALYVEGSYDAAMEPWLEVLDMNSNYELAYHAIGKALFKQERYYEAMQYFRTARTKLDYSGAFREYRKEYMREHFTEITVGIISFYLLIKFGFWYRKRSKNRRVNPVKLLKGDGVK